MNMLLFVIIHLLATGSEVNYRASRVANSATLLRPCINETKRIKEYNESRAFFEPMQDDSKAELDDFR